MIILNSFRKKMIKFAIESSAAFSLALDEESEFGEAMQKLLGELHLNIINDNLWKIKNGNHFSEELRAYLAEFPSEEGFELLERVIIQEIENQQ